MKSILQLSLICFVCATVFACKSKKSTTVTNTTTTTTSQTISPKPSSSVPATPPKEETTRFVVGFYSIGAGIDNKTNDEFVNFLNSYPKKIAYTPTFRGREGEVNYCLELKELSLPEQVEFIKKANAILEKSKLVHVQENIKCEHSNLPTPPAPPAANDNYRLVVTFFSAGEGIDFKTKEDFDRFVSAYTKKVAYEAVAYGREGEIDYCLKLNELSSSEQDDFVRKAKELLNKSKLVHVNENANCVHKH
jgi:hypothetical protein